VVERVFPFLPHPSMSGCSGPRKPLRNGRCSRTRPLCTALSRVIRPRGRGAEMGRCPDGQRWGCGDALGQAVPMSGCRRCSLSRSRLWLGCPFSEQLGYNCTPATARLHWDLNIGWKESCCPSYLYYTIACLPLPSTDGEHT
jgi:hypothetical protein